MTTFKQFLKVSLIAKSRLNRKERRLLDALNAKNPGPLQRRQIALAETHARELTGFTGDDWSKVKAADWSAIFDKLIDFITRLLALFA